MPVIIILWAALVSQLVSTTQVYQKCKDKSCEVKVEKVGYKIVEKGE